MMRHKIGRRGVTLTEIMTVSALFVTLLTGLVSTGMSAGTEYSNGTAKMMADDQASLMLQKMVREIRNGVRATVTSPTDFTVVLPAVNAQGDYDRYVAGTRVRYFLLGNKIMRQENSAASTTLARNIREVAFAAETTTSGLRYRISLTSRQQGGKNFKDTTLSTTVSLRNEEE